MYSTSKNRQTVDVPQDLFWQLCHWPLEHEDVFVNISDYLANADTKEQLLLAESLRTYPMSIRKELHQLVVGDILFSSPDNPGPRNTLAHLYALTYVCSRSNVSVAIDVGVNALALMPIYRAGTVSQQTTTAQHIRDGKFYSLLISERSHGSDILANQFTHEPEHDGNGEMCYWLTGQKDWINGGSTHECRIVLSREKSGTRTSPRSFTLFLTQATDDTISVEKRWRNCPAPAADIASVKYLRHKCTESDQVGEPGSGFSLIQDSFSITRGLVGCGAMGLASRITSAICQHINSRQLYRRPLKHIEVIAEKYQRAKALELIIACLTMKCLFVQNLYGVGASHYSNLTKYATPHFLEELAILGRDILSAHALFEEYEFHTVLRDYSLLGIFDGTAAICLEQIQGKLIQSTSKGYQSVVSIDEFQQIFTADLRSAHDSLSKENDCGVILFRPDQYAEAIEVDKHYSIDTQYISTLFVNRIETLKHSGLWFTSQSYRHNAAQGLAYLECIFAINDICTRSKEDFTTLAQHSVAVCTEQVLRSLLTLHSHDHHHDNRLWQVLATAIAEQQGNLE